MAAELVVRIDKSFWPKGVVRGLNPELRKIGDKHGNLVIAAQPAKGEIMIKGDAKDIEAAKDELRKVLSEHLPDAPTPDELKPAEAKASPKTKAAAAPKTKTASPKTKPEASPKKGATPAPKKDKSATAPAAPKAKPVVAVSTIPAKPPVKPVVLRQEPKAAIASPSLLWQIMRGNSSLVRKQARSVAPTSGPSSKRPRFSADPCNLLGLHTERYSGAAATQALDIRTKKSASGKETIELIQSHANSSRRRRPKAAYVATGLSKSRMKGLAQLGIELDAKFYRRGLQEIAKSKYNKVLQSFKKKARKVFSRRNQSTTEN